LQEAHQPPLAGLLVVEYGDRLAVTACCTLLAQLGAEVVLIERPQSASTYKWTDRTLCAAGKRSVIIDPARDAAMLAELLQRADIIVSSSDVTPLTLGPDTPNRIVCDITAFGGTGPLTGTPASDAEVQSLSGLADTTGNPAGAPTLIGFPFCELSAGLYAAAAIMVACRVRRTQGPGQHIDIALFDCAVNALSTFLPFHMIGKPVTRAGNGHSLAAPWNAYRASDGWVLICTATDDQWRRLCSVTGQPELAQSPGFVTNAERVASRAAVDAAVERWTTRQTVQQCITQLSELGIACGPILPVTHLMDEPNLAHRKMVWTTQGATGDATRRIPGSPLGASLPLAASAQRVPDRDADRDWLVQQLARTKQDITPRNTTAGTRPLAGLRVLEIGQYTTAPLVSRQLGALGAEVFKIEPPGGEGARTWPPTRGNQGYFFAFSNSDKKSLELDLRKDEDRGLFRSLLKTADVLVENLKPGSLARLGFGADALHAINSRLVYCGISGFGAESIYPGRPAFDTVVQAMSGIMDLTRAEGVPTKAGISAADIMGGEFGLLAILTALEMRDCQGSGLALDISMQDAAAWAAGYASNTGRNAAHHQIVRCTDGFVCIDSADGQTLRTVLQTAAPADAPLSWKGTRAELVAQARTHALAATPVCTVTEVAEHPHVAARKLIIECAVAGEEAWPLMNSPLRLALTPATVRRPIGKLGEANQEVLALLARLPSAANQE